MTGHGNGEFYLPCLHSIPTGTLLYTGPERHRPGFAPFLVHVIAITFYSDA
jgi:hypothetical protein